MIHLRTWKCQKGVASSWSLIVLVSLIVVLGAAVYLLLPRPEIIEPEPVVTRMKIPPMPPPEPAPSTKGEQPWIAEAETASPQDQEYKAGPAPAGETSQTAASSDPDDQSTNSDASAEQTHDAPKAASPAAAGEEQPTPLTAAANAPPAGPIVESRPTVGNAPQHEKPADDNTPPPPGAEETEGTTPSDRVLAAAEKEKEADKSDGIEPASLRSQERAGPPADQAEKRYPYTVQVGVYHRKENADNMASGLEALGYASFIHESQDKHQRPLYKVCFGRFEAKSEAAQTAATFKEKEEKPALVVRLESR